MNMIKNRLDKNLKKLKPWADRLQIEAFRLYERDIPEYPFIVDVYRDHLVIYDRSQEGIDSKESKLDHFPELIEAVRELFAADEDHIIVKRRQRQKGESQYTRMDKTGHCLSIREGPALLQVNLRDYLDTGLFLDHRIMREKIYRMAEGKNFLNLFSYTGSVSVFAALGGAITTSVDMSATYTRWAEENFEMNRLPLGRHRFVTENALEFLQHNQGQREFDLIFLDPPTFSNSKRMEREFEVERDQEFLVDGAMALLKKDGILFFSNNKRTFRLNPALANRYSAKDISASTIPKDFRDPKIHHVFEFRHRMPS